MRLLAVLLIMTPSLQAQTVPPVSAWKHQISFPDEPFRAAGSSAAEPDWIKFTILLDPYDPNTVYFQDCRQYTFHYDFALDHLEPFADVTLPQYEQATLYGEDQRAVLGAVLMPPTGGLAVPFHSAEYGIQFVRHDPFTREQLARLFFTVKSNIISDPNTRAYYFPTYEQIPMARDHQAWLLTQGIPVSSSARWAEGNVCYSEGWALGRLRYIEGAKIERAYQSGMLRPNDILLTDGVPAEIPAVAGIISLSASTPNSHVAILAQTLRIPFAYLALKADADCALQLAEQRVVLRVFERYWGTEVNLINIEGVLDEATINDVLSLKQAPELSILPMASYGALSCSTDRLTPADIQYVGGKAANFGVLRRAIPDHSPVAAAFTFDLWQGFLSQGLPSGRSLQQEIITRLAPYRYPPSDMALLTEELADIRDMFRDDQRTDITQTQQAAILTVLQDPQYGFDSNRRLRIRSSTNVEDSSQFSGAGLYDSYSGCLADDLDADADGPNICNPGRSNERGVFRAIRRVFASFYNLNAFLERLRYGVNEADVGMALLVHHSFPDDIELANGVATLQTSGDASWAFELVTQSGATSVTNPTDGSLAESVTGHSGTAGIQLTLLRPSNLVPLGATVMDWQEDYLDLVRLLTTAAEQFAASTGRHKYTLDFEYKKTAPNGDLVVKQVREIPQHDNGNSITPFLLNQATHLCTFQGEYTDVFANHRLKCCLHLETKNLWMTHDALLLPLYTWASLDFTADGHLQTLSGTPSLWPEAAHHYGNGRMSDAWRIQDLANPLSLELEIEHIPTELGSSEAPVLTLSDLGRVRLHARYDRPVLTWGWMGPTTTTSETVELYPCAQKHPQDVRQQRSFAWPTSGVSISSCFFWPPPPKDPGLGYTSPLVRWEETCITGYTAEPIILRNWYAQTYCPGHHNLTEHFLFEPRLDPDVSEVALAALRTKNIRLIYVHKGLAESTLMTYGFDE